MKISIKPCLTVMVGVLAAFIAAPSSAQDRFLPQVRDRDGVYRGPQSQTYRPYIPPQGGVFRGPSSGYQMQRPAPLPPVAHGGYSGGYSGGRSSGSDTYSLGGGGSRTTSGPLSPPRLLDPFDPSKDRLSRSISGTATRVLQWGTRLQRR